MNFKKYFKRRKFGFLHFDSTLQKAGLLHHVPYGTWLHFLIPALVVAGVVGTVATQVPNLRLAAFQFTKPKPIIASGNILPTDVQQAIEILASQEIKQEQANANLSFSSSSTQTSQAGLIQNAVLSVQEALTSNPSEKAKLEIKIIDNLIAKLQKESPGKQVETIKEIGSKTDQIVKNPNSQADRAVLQLLIEQYNRLQLILQQTEDNLPVSDYLKVEDARQKYLVVTAMDSINNAPNLDAVHNLAIKEVAKVVGDDFAELKAIEIISDFEAGVKPEAREKLSGLERELAVSFEKKMLKLPQDVRERKLQDFIKYSFGDPIRQIQSFSRMKDFLSDRELIMGVDSLKELALKKFEDRLFELSTSQLPQQFNSKLLNTPENLKIFVQAQMDIESGTDKKWALLTGPLSERAEQAIVELFGKDKNKLLQAFPQNSQPDLLDIMFINKLDKVLTGSSEVSSEINQEVRNIKQRQIQNFITNISKKNFVTQSKLGYNPVPVNADVRLLLSSPFGLKVLQDQKLDIALRAQAQIIGEHLLLQVNDSEIFEKYQQFISDNPQVKQALQSFLGQSFVTNLAKKKQAIDKQSSEDQQKLYEKMQQIIQNIFLTADYQKSDLEKHLPQDIQNQIQKLKQELADRNVPKIDTPEGVNLPEVAKLPDEVENAIVAAAKKKIEEENRPKEVELDLSLQAKDLGVSDPIILPGNPLYVLKEVLRTVELVITLDPIARAEELIKQDNEKTLEAAKLVEQNQDTETIDLALDTLKDVQSDFDKLKEHASELEQLNQTQPEKVSELVDQIIENGVARQTVLASIEDKVYGDTYVEVEKVRSDILKDGVDTLLEITNNNVPELIQKLEQVVESSSGSELKDIKAVELLTEISKTQPEEVQQILDNSIDSLAKSLEDKLLAMPEEQRVEKVLDYVDASPGNPVIQFEAADELKSHFDNPETIALTEGIKDQAVENLTNLISEITDGTSKQEFVDIVVGEKSEDLKIITDIEIRVTPPESEGEIEETPIVEAIKEIKAEVEQNIIEAYKDNVEVLAQDLTPEADHVTDILDVNVIQEIVEVLERSPEVTPEVVKEAQKLEEIVVDNFVEDVSKEANQALTPVPEVIAQLVELKEETPPSVGVKIDAAIKAEVNLIEDHLTNEVNDPQTFENYVAQIEENPIVAQTVAQVGGSEFTQVIEQKAAEVETTAATEQTTLVETVKQIEQEIFSTSGESQIEQTLPQTVQEEIQQIKQEVPQEQIPQVEVTATVNVTTPESTIPQSTPEPVSVPTETAAPAPAAPEVTAPAPEQPTAPPPDTTVTEPLAPTIGL